jgi:hypothetical protein
VEALIDCGANINYINKEWSEQMEIESKDHGKGTIRAYTGDCVKEDIRIATIKFKIQGRVHEQKFRILTKTGSDKIVLGLPWLKEYNPNIDWLKEKISFVEERISKVGSAEGPLDQKINWRFSKPITKTDSTREKDATVDRPQTRTEEYEAEITKAKDILPKRLHQFLDIFVQKEYRLPEYGENDLAIKLKKGAVLPKVKQRRYTREDSLEIKKQLTELLQKGKIRPSRSDSAVGTLFVPKADGTRRWCMDMRPVNNATIPDENKSPLQDITRERLIGAKYFTRLDMRDGYHHLRIREGDEKHTAFITEYGLYEWTVACFGLRNAPAEFARFMSKVLMEFINDFVVVYFDDIVIFSKDLEEHWIHVEKVLKKIKEAKINLKAKKCEFAVMETKFLGHVVNGNEIRMQEEKIATIMNWPTPKTLKHIEQFRGMIGYYRYYIKHFTDVLKTLNQKLKEKVFTWNKKDDEAFKTAKEKVRDSVLGLHDPEKEIFVHTDASDYAIGAEISQINQENGKLRPILFYSRRLTPAEENYTTADKEMLAIVATMKKFPHYLRGTKFQVVVKSDHKNLSNFTTNKELNARQARWAEDLSAYDFRIEHIAGKSNIIADTLSRNPDYEKEEKTKRSFQMLEEKEGNLILNREVKIKMITFKDEDNCLVEDIKKETKKEKNDTAIEEDGFRRFQGLIKIPRSMEERVISRYHDDPREGHQGETKTLEKIQRNLYFSGMTRKIKRYIGKCEKCQKGKIDTRKPYGLMEKWQHELKTPWRHITMDFVHMPERDGMNQLLVVTDRFTKFTVLIITRKTITTEELFQLLWERIFSIFGIPETMTSDRDKLTRNEKWKELTGNLGIILIISTANHQRTDGQTERKMQEIQAYLRMFLPDQKDWKEWIPILQFALNDAISTTTKETPHNATFGTDRKNVWNKEFTNEEEKTDKLSKLHRQMALEIKWNHEKMKEYYDKSRVEAPCLERGDRVYLRRRTKGNSKDNIPSKKEVAKLDDIFLGPFKIKKKLPFNNYELWLPPKMKIHPVFHISLLKPTENKATKEDIDLREYEVEKIVDQRKKGSQKFYKVRWKGFSREEDTWEPQKNLNCPTKIQEFEESLASSTSSKGLQRLAKIRKTTTTKLTQRFQKELQDQKHSQEGLVADEHELQKDEQNSVGNQQAIGEKYPRMSQVVAVRRLRLQQKKQEHVRQVSTDHLLDQAPLTEKRNDYLTHSNKLDGEAHKSNNEKIWPKFDRQCYDGHKARRRKEPEHQSN